MMTSLSFNEMTAAIHASEYRGVFFVTGECDLLASVLVILGTSRTTLKLETSDSPTALSCCLGRFPEHCRAEQIARQMAVAAWWRALQMAAEAERSVLFGFALTVNFDVDGSLQREYRVHAAFHTMRETRAYTLELSDSPTWEEAKERLAHWVMSVLAECLHLEAPQIPSVHSVEAPEEWSQLALGLKTFVEVPLRGQPVQWSGIFPGSFAPLHPGHAKMHQLASEILGGDVALELAVRNADKPPLDYIEIQQRLRQITDAPFFTGSTLLLSALPFFQMKAEAFPDTTFVVGTDTLERIADVRFHDGDREAMRLSHCRLAELGCRFLVFGRRQKDGTFLSLEDLPLPSELKSLCTGVPESAFRMDISSTQLRKSSAL